MSPLTLRSSPRQDSVNSMPNRLIIALLIFVGCLAVGVPLFADPIHDAGPDDDVQDAGLSDEATPLPVETEEDKGDADFDGWGDADDFGVDEGFDAKEKNSDFGYRIHGSFENQLQGMWIWLYGGGNGSVVNNYVRLRVDLDVDLPGGLALRSDGVAKMIAGQTEIKMRDLIPDRTLEALMAQDPRFRESLEEKYTYENEYYLDNAYLKVPIKSLLLFLGKQPLEQGVGYAWNPTDVFTKKDIFDPTYEKPGVIALRGILSISEMASIDLVGVPDGSFSNWVGWAS